MQVAAVVACVPGGQGPQAGAPGPLKVPAAQGVQAALLALPGVGLLVPGGHGTHASAPLPL